MAKWLAIGGPALLLAVLVMLWPASQNGGLAHAGWLPWAASPTAADPETAWFRRCSGPARYSCVVDGDTIYYRGEKIRILGIDTPELYSAKCAEEERRAEAATAALAALLNEAAFTIAAPPGSPPTDRYGRSLREIRREGRDLADVMIAQGHGRAYQGDRRQGWCG